MRSQCTANKKGRIIKRNIFTPNYEQNARNIAANRLLYKQRQALIEHVFGTMKRQWSYCHILTKKGKHHATADVGLMFIAYNLRRIFNFVGKKALLNCLGMLTLLFSWIATMQSEPLQICGIKIGKPVLPCSFLSPAHIVLNSLRFE